ncbi:amino acid deaminase [Rhodoferax sp.]|uniref:amino acid deaminase n=1 Tax=Rhodoferax sp. TaxID=50421 RepID=UPI002845CFA1|nr:amino acid deaminase [Rhodoferax sp.]MDR3371416.1 amino acid deaminase [Rhodoferax sp.]
MFPLLDPLIDHTFKGFPHSSVPLHLTHIGTQGWNVLNGDLPLPLAVIKRDVMQHNLAWMQDFAASRGLGLAPHGKTSMSPRLFRRQLDAGAWGMTFATVTQAGIGVAAGTQACLIANQVFAEVDLTAINTMKQTNPELRVIFLVDSVAQLGLIEDWRQQHPVAPAFEVLLEVGVSGGRTGCRTLAQALNLAEWLHESAAVHLVGIECYEGLAASGQSAEDESYVSHLMELVQAVARACDAQDLFDTDEVLLTAGGSAIFDLVVPGLKLQLNRPVTGLLRSGCYVTHDQGSYQRMMSAVAQRTGCGAGLEAALEVWASVQSCPEPGLAILAVGKRDVSYDVDLPTPLLVCPRGTRELQAVPADWRITKLNDQHAYLQGDGPLLQALQVGDRVCLGISHPCTTFDKWRWMPLVDVDYNVVDAVATFF